MPGKKEILEAIICIVRAEAEQAASSVRRRREAGGMHPRRS